MAKLEPNAETFRIRALAYVTAKDLARARLEIRKALELEPRWESVRFAAATIDYLSALAPAALPESLVSWPAPVDWALVKRDDESFSRLREAANAFRELAEETGKGKEEHQTLESWYLACIANLPERQEEAIEYCRGLLQADQTHYRAIAWAVGRNFEIDLKPSEKAIEKLVMDGSAEILHIIALVSCYLASQRAKNAVKLLDDMRPKFQEHQAEILWTFWYVQSLVMSGNPKTALRAIDDSGSMSELRQARTMALRSVAKETNDWQRLIQHLEGSFDETGDPNFLFQCCGLMARRQNWVYVADRAEVLVKEIGTAEALRLAAIAAYNAKRFDLCLRLLDDHRDFFSGQKLPAELRRMRALCQHALGVLPQAIAEAETLAREEPTTENLLALSQIYFTKGDLKGLALVARQLDERSDLTAEESLRIARLVQFEDQQLAVALWRRAKHQGLPDEAVGAVVSLGYQLGMDDELGPILERMANLGRQERGGIQMGTIEDFVSLVEQQREYEAKLHEIYQKGSAPIHVIAERVNRPLVELYHRLLAENEAASDPIRQASLLVRHGGRGLVSGFPDDIPKWRLNLDVTAVLLAEHLGILSLVERTFEPLHIPADLIPALVQMRDSLTHHQPSRLLAYQQIVDLTRRGTLQVEDFQLSPAYENTKLVDELGENWVALFEGVRATGGYLVDFLPLMKRDLSGPPSAPPKDADRYLVNCRSIMEALRQQGPLSAVEYQKALEGLGDQGLRHASEAIPDEGSRLFCHANIPEVLANAKLLDIVCERFRVRIEQREFDQVRTNLQEHQRMSEVAEWLDSLIDRLRQGIDGGTWVVIPAGTDRGTELEKKFVNDLTFGCLLTLMRFETRERDIIWADDRCLNSYLRRDSVPIIGVNEVLKSLVSIGALQVGDYYEKVMKLRAANVRFIPVEKDEILYHLRQARVQDDTLVETQALTVLRRYVATCLLHGDILQRPPMPEGAPNKNGEVAFVMGLGRAITGALVEIWADEEQSDNTCRAHAEWIVANLYIDHLGMFNVTSIQRSEQDDRYLVALSLAGLISQAIPLGTNRKGERASARRRYLDWLFNRLLRKRFDTDPYLIAAIADILKKSLTDAQQGPLGKDSPPLVIQVLQAFYDDFPMPIRDELGRDTDFMASISLRSFVSANIDGLSFDPDDFLRAVSEVIKGHKTTIVPIESGKEITFEPFEGRRDKGVFCFKHPISRKTMVVADDIFELLLESPMERESVLRRNRHWFDCANEPFDRIVAQIVSIEDPRRRLEEAESWRHASAAVFYQVLYRNLKEHHEFQFSSQLPPSGEGLLRHFRLASNVGRGDEFQEALMTAARTLIGEEGLELAIDRLVGLPVPLPVELTEAVVRLSEADRRLLVKRLLKIGGSPVSRIQFVRVLLSFSSETPAYFRLARRIIINLLSEKGAEDFHAFLAILNWSNEEFNHWSDTHDWPPHLCLAMVWAHAHRLNSIFASLGVRADWVRRTFSHGKQRIVPEMFEREPHYWFDVTHPRRVCRETFLLGGLSYSIGKETVAFVEQGLRDLLAAEVFREIEGVRLPTFSLLRDTTQAQNSLNSFLGGDWGERLSPLIGAEDAGNFARTSLKKLVEQALNNLAEARDEFSSWAMLHAVLGDLPHYTDMTDQLRAIMRQTDFSGLVQKDASYGKLVLQTASLRLINLADENLRRHLKDQLVKIAKLLADRDSDDVAFDTVSDKDFNESREMNLILLESALNISIAARPSQHVIAEFGDLVLQLAEAWHSMIHVAKPIVQRLCEELPVSNAKQLWSLLIRLRAE